MGAVASQITSFTIVYSTVDSDADQRKHQSSASLAFVRGINRGPVNSPHKCPVTRKMVPFDDVIMFWFLPLSFRWILGYIDFIFCDRAQSVICAVGKIHNGLEVVFCLIHGTPSHYHHHAELLICIENIRRKKILWLCINACWVFSVKSVSKMQLVLRFSSLFEILGFMC